jgi:histidinol-phosphatase (PHP family)
MYYADYHIHSDFSADGKDPMEDIIQEAIKRGLQEIAFTEHYDYGQVETGKPFLVDTDKYRKTFLTLKEKYQKQIKLIFGVELGLIPEVKPELSTYIEEYPFDFIIGSSHSVWQKDIAHCKDYFFGQRTKKEAYQIYFEEVLRCIKLFDEFDVYGHLDYMMRYADYADRKIYYLEFRDIIDEILKALIHKNKGLEINTSGYRYNLELCHPGPEILKRYKELGGEIITVGSDTHTAKGVCTHFKEAYAMLKKCGFSYMTLFEQRKPRFYPIKA